MSTEIRGEPIFARFLAFLSEFYSKMMFLVFFVILWLTTDENLNSLYQLRLIIDDLKLLDLTSSLPRAPHIHVACNLEPTTTSDDSPPQRRVAGCKHYLVPI